MTIVGDGERRTRDTRNGWAERDGKRNALTSGDSRGQGQASDGENRVVCGCRGDRYIRSRCCQRTIGSSAGSNCYVANIDLRGAKRESTELARRVRMLGTYALATGHEQESGPKKQQGGEFRTEFHATGHGLRHIRLANRDPTIHIARTRGTARRIQCAIAQGFAVGIVRTYRLFGRWLSGLEPKSLAKVTLRIGT